VQYVAVCDVRKGIMNAAKERADRHYQNSDCQNYADFRDILARTDIDAVHIATPDHWHAIQVIQACVHGKDVYCQKPESKTLREGPLSAWYRTQPPRLRRDRSQPRSDRQ
jgi:predicted dehydrogenase